VAAALLGRSVSSRRQSEGEAEGEEPGGAARRPGDCCKCGGGGDEGLLLDCDRCERAFHVNGYCHAALAAPPGNEWVCDECVASAATLSSANGEPPPSNTARALQVRKEVRAACQQPQLRGVRLLCGSREEDCPSCFSHSLAGSQRGLGLKVCGVTDEKARTITIGSRVKVEWQCETCKHKFTAMVVNVMNSRTRNSWTRNSSGRYCPFCNRKSFCKDPGCVMCTGRPAAC